MISEGSCDTEDWSNDAESSGINYILKHKQSNYFKLQKYLITTVFTVFPIQYMQPCRAC